MTTRIGIAGAMGRMGQTLIADTIASDDLQLGIAVDSGANDAGAVDVGTFIGQPTHGVALTDRLPDLQTTPEARIDVLIDFSSVPGALVHSQWCAQHDVNLVLGVTGFSESETTTLHAQCGNIALLHAPNMSIGVNVLLQLIEAATRKLQAGAAGGGYDIEIFEAHHRQKLDSPSGTALKMGQVAANASGGSFDNDKVLHREGRHDARRQADIGFSTMRAGAIIGKHQISFISDSEQIDIAHQSYSRHNYSQGALRAARFIAGRAAGRYQMSDVLADENV